MLSPGYQVFLLCETERFLLSPQSTSGSAQVGLLPQGVRLLRSPAVPQASSDAFPFPQTACPPEQSFMVEDVSTPKVGPTKDTSGRRVFVLR